MVGDDSLKGPHERSDVRLQDQRIDAADLRRQLPALPGCGGFASFEGHIRDSNHGKQVVRLDYEVYPELATKELRRVVQEAVERYALGFARCIHRTGTLEIGETAVLIHVLSRHRDAAFDGCRYIIDELKTRVPIWKKEYYYDGSHDWSQCHAHHRLEPAL